MFFFFFFSPLFFIITIVVFFDPTDSMPLIDHSLCLSSSSTHPPINRTSPFEFVEGRVHTARYREASKCARIDWAERETEERESDIRSKAIEKGEDPDEAVANFREEMIRKQEEEDQQDDAASSSSRPTSAMSRISLGSTSSSRTPTPILSSESTAAPIELSYRPLLATAHVLLRCLERDPAASSATQGGAGSSSSSSSSLDVQFVAAFCVLTLRVLAHVDRRVELLELGKKLMEQLDWEASTAEKVLPLMVFVQRQTWRCLDTKATLARTKVETHDSNWKRSEEARAKKRKRRLITVGMRPEEKAYLDIRTRLQESLEEWSLDEERERGVLENLEEKLHNLRRDKSNSVEALDAAKKTLRRYLEGRGPEPKGGENGEGSVAGGGGGGGGGDVQGTSRTARSRATNNGGPKSTARSKRSSKGGGSSSSKGGSKKGGGSGSANELDNDEPVWIGKVLRQFDKVVSMLRTKRETPLLVEALECLGDFQASRDGVGGLSLGGEGATMAASSSLLVPNFRRREAASKNWSDGKVFCCFAC